MFQKIALAFQDKDLRSKILKVLGLLIIARILTHVPIPGVSGANGNADISSLVDSNSFFGLLNVISGGGYGVLSFVMLGISPYITASIIFQLLGIIVPKIAEIRKEEGQAGERKINKWTRWLTVPLAALQAWGVLKYISSQPDLADKIKFEGVWHWALAIVAMVAGCIIIMWIGELITEYKVGNGVSLIMLSGIVVQLPQSMAENWKYIQAEIELLWKKLNEGHWDYLYNLTAWKNFWTNPEWANLRSFSILMLSFVITLLLVVFMNDAIRKILIVYTRRGHSEGSSRLLDAVKADLPLKVNVAGVVPIIFAVSFILFPTVVSTMLTTANIDSVREQAQKVEQFLSPNPTFYPGTQHPVREPLILNNKSFLGFYKVDNQEQLLAAKEFDSTQGADLFGFTINNFDRDCNPSQSDETAKNFKEKANSSLFNFEFGCQSKPFGFLPEFGLHWQGISAYNFLYFILIIFFTYFYSANVAFKTDDISENLQQSGAYIPGFKPGKETENYLNYVSNRLNVVGSIFLAVVALLPIIMSQYLTFSQHSILSSVVGGTSILILVSVTVDTLRQINAQITSANYDRFIRENESKKVLKNR